MYRLLIVVCIAAIVFNTHGAEAVVVPSSGCYALDNSSRIYDFTSWIGYPFQYDGKGDQDADLVVRFCKDVETRSQTGYLDFGRYDRFNHFFAGSGSYNFVQEYYHGDLINCEKSFDKMGRTSQVNILCGNCPNGQCKGGLGCICNVIYESTCRALVELAIPCEKPGGRVFEGFTVGFHPRSWEIVYNGMTKQGYDHDHKDFSFVTEQTNVVLYLTAVASLSHLVQKPIVKVYPENGLQVKLSGSATTDRTPTTLSPTMLTIDWTCENSNDKPYAVEITIPIENYDPVQFFLTKTCEHKQNAGSEAVKGWAFFGIFCCILIVFSTLFCSSWFVYKTRVEHQRGLDALPGMTVLGACLEAVSGGGISYTRAEDTSSRFANEASWERPPPPPPPQASVSGTRRSIAESKYGAI